MIKFLFKLIRKIIKTVIITAMVLVTVTTGTYILIRENLNFDPYNVIKYGIILGQPVDESSLCSNSFTSKDMEDVKSVVNSSVADMISYSIDKGYSINFTTPATMTDNILISDTQMGAFVQEAVKQETEGKIGSGDAEIDFEIKQIDLFEVVDGDACLNCVIKIDISSIKTNFEKFPLSLLKNRIPDYLYVSSTVFVDREDNSFEYTLSHRSITINNLNEFQTDELFTTLSTISDIGTAEDLSINIADAVMSLLVGNESQNGLVYSLKDAGASGFGFVESEGVEYLAVIKNELI